MVPATLATGLLNWSWTITAGGVVTAVPTAADWLLPALTAIEVGAPAVPVAVNVTGLPFSPVDVAVRGLTPAGLPRVQLPTLAKPPPVGVLAAPGMLPRADAGAQG